MDADDWVTDRVALHVNNEYGVYCMATDAAKRAVRQARREDAAWWQALDLVGEAVRDAVLNVIDQDCVDGSFSAQLLRDLLDLGSSNQWQQIGTRFIDDPAKALGVTWCRVANCREMTDDEGTCPRCGAQLSDN